MSIEIVTAQTEDGLILHGAWQTAGGPALDHGSQPDAALLLHGVGGNFYRSRLFDRLSEVFRERGIHVLRVNTRGHDELTTVGATFGARRVGAALEIVDECRHDVRAWLDFLERCGMRRVVLVGHSLGAIKAVYFDVFEQHALLFQVVALSPPRLSYEAFRNGPSGPSFQACMREAQRLVEAQRGEELISVTVPLPLVLSAATYVDKYGPRQRYDITKFANRVRHRCLFTYGGQELEQGGVAFAGLPDQLRACAASDQDLHVHIVPTANHHYQKRESELARHVADWMGNGD